MTTVPTVSDAADDLMLGFEVSSRTEYRPEPCWPGGASGVTVGVGYDCGYHTAAQIRGDWTGLLPPTTVETLAGLAGLCGAKAAAAAPVGLRVPWVAAEAVYRRVSIPRAAAATIAAYPTAGSLPADSFGALVSLVFNRGGQLTASDPATALRRIEMAQIGDALAAGRPRDVPAYIRAMCRIWPASGDQAGLRRRRMAEAQLYERGLQATV